MDSHESNLNRHLDQLTTLQINLVKHAYVRLEQQQVLQQRLLHPEQVALLQQQQRATAAAVAAAAANAAAAAGSARRPAATAAAPGEMWHSRISNGQLAQSAAAAAAATAADLLGLDAASLGEHCMFLVLFSLPLLSCDMMTTCDLDDGQLLSNVHLILATVDALGAFLDQLQYLWTAVCEDGCTVPFLTSWSHTLRSCCFAAVLRVSSQEAMYQLLPMQQASVTRTAAEAAAATAGYNHMHPAGAAAAAGIAVSVSSVAGVAAEADCVAEAGVGQQVTPAGMMSSVTTTAHLSRVLQAR
jgi:hypothetical protein